MPTPNPGESQDDFISRCMSSDEARSTHPDQDERLGMCFGLWEGSRKSAADPAVAQFRKSDDALQIVWAEVYVPNVLDTHGHFMGVETVRKAAHAFLAAGRVGKTNIEHEGDSKGAVVVESFVARKGDPDFIADAWVMAMHVPDPAVWALIKSGEINGFSLEGLAVQEAAVLKVDVPRVVVMMTEADDTAHGHEVVANYAEDGTFLGARALTGGTPPGHEHAINKGTVTEAAGNPPHTHRFNLTKALANANADQ